MEEVKVMGGLVAIPATLAAVDIVTDKPKKPKKKRNIKRDRKFVSKQEHEKRYKRKTPGKVYKKK